ncbi:MAG: hypothetical protein ABIF18_04125 [archaeon]
MNEKIGEQSGEADGINEKISRLRYGVIHSQIGFSDGVSIVMEQMESVLTENLNISKNNILYLVGKSNVESKRVTEAEVLWDRYKINLMMLSHFESGFGGGLSEKIELAIWNARAVIEKWISDNKIDILIVHNSSHPVNFISSVALSRFYRDSIRRGKKTPKYILWWHDSHVERKHFKNPSRDVEKYLLEGVPGRFVEYVVFINNLQLSEAHDYFLRIDKRYPGFYKRILSNYNVAYNTTNTFIDSFRDIENSENNVRLKRFMKDFKVESVLNRHHLKLKEVLFCLQHTRVIERKRIDFALKYCYELLSMAKKEKFKAIYFLVSGQIAEPRLRKKLELLNTKLYKKHGAKVFLVFAEDYSSKTKISFNEYPMIFAKLGGFSSYFSEVEGFGNNLLEVLASGLIPVVYKYPVFKRDIEKYNFELLALDEFKIREEDLKETLKIIKKKRKKKKMVNRNLEILREHFPHNVLAMKLMEAITKERGHI